MAIAALLAVTLPLNSPKSLIFPSASRACREYRDFSCFSALSLAKVLGRTMCSKSGAKLWTFSNQLLFFTHIPIIIASSSTKRGEVHLQFRFKSSLTIESD